MIFFVSGNDTDIGKTFVSSLLLKSLSKKYNKIAYVKPIESGVSQISQSDLSFVKKSSDFGKKVDFFQFILFKEPVAPFTASLIEKRSISYPKIVKNIKTLEKEYDLLVIEGAGGLRVPITKSKEIVDLIKSIKAIVILVISPFLGTLNHTFMSIETLKVRKIPLEGVVINSYPYKPNISEVHNPIIINSRKIKILGVIPRMTNSLKKSKNIHLKSLFSPRFGGQFCQVDFIEKCQNKFEALLKKYAN